MDMESLKLVLDTIKEVSQTAGNVGLTWVVIHYIVQGLDVLLSHAAAPLALTIICVKAVAAAVKWRGTEQVVTRIMKIDNLTINEGVWDALRVQLARLNNGGVYIHASDVAKLRKALDLFEQTEQNGKPKT